MRRIVCLITALTIIICTFGCARTQELDEALPSMDNKGAQTEQTPSPQPSTQTPTDTEPQNKTPVADDDFDTDDVDDDASIEIEPEPDTEPDTETDTTVTAPVPESTETTATIVEINAQNYNPRKLELPKLNISTLGGEISKTEYIPARLSIDNVEQGYGIEGCSVDIRGRGNSTWAYFDKKPYKLRFAVKTDLLGMGAAKKWVLLANAIDDTMLRSALAYDLAHRLGVEYTTDYRFVNVFINEEYLGVYLLCEQTEEGETRVNVDSSKTGELNTGYLLEMWNNTWEKTDKNIFELPKVNGVVTTARCVIHSPGKKTLTVAQKSFISGYLLDANKAVLNKDWQKINEYFDIDSVINMFLVETVFLNADAGHSFFVYKPKGDKLHLGPLWDIDQSAGNSSIAGEAYDGWFRGAVNRWYKALVEIPEFMDAVRERYYEKYDDIHGVIDRVDSFASENAYDFAMSNYVYNNFGNAERYRTIPAISSLTTYKEHLTYLKTWMANRLGWIEENL